MKKNELQGIGMTSDRTRKRLVDRLAREGITDTRVLAAIANTPRHLFIEEALAHRAYEDTALPIGLGQTISQPYIVARMTELLLAHMSSHKKILEIGTGSGYQTAILAQLVEQIYTIERLEKLLSRARRILRTLGFSNINYRHGDGSKGWAKHGLFDGIIVTAGASHVPTTLVEQLNEGGCMIIPVGANQHQMLELIVRKGNKFEKNLYDPVRFVPLIED